MSNKQIPVLTEENGKDDFPLWKRWIDNEAGSVPGLWRHFSGEVKYPRMVDRKYNVDDKGNKTPKVDDSEWSQIESASKAGNLIFTSVDRYHHIDIANIDSQADQYKFLIQKYQGENFGRLHQLCRSILCMAQISTLPVDSEVSRIKTDNKQISQQDKSMKLSDRWLSDILILSMDEGFETEISLIQDKDPPLTFDQIHCRFKTKETSIETPPESINAAR
ncbi:hypothetical protein GcC1_103032 [Golovinomyces cichoracearum]|uniref:Uncharacterized protein n=1 Tax=Golovinomyces cichoracearum TaxID=62708 RepID=A0A420I9R1_9PEZI|nr:hypothetical protein GcC1_103032 [Golovinomyces cichoracearum]